MLKSKLFALFILLLSVAVTVVVFILCPTWYWFGTAFFLYMAGFCHLCSLLFDRMSPRSCIILHNTAIGCACLALVGVITSIVMMLI